MSELPQSVYKLIKSANISLGIFNTLGQRIKILEDAYRPAGEYSLAWNATDEMDHDVSSGIYICRLHADERILQKKMLLVR